MKIDSLLNYIGHKSKIQELIFQNLPTTVSGTFYDIFAGSAVIGLNAPYSDIKCVEINPHLTDLYRNIQHPRFIQVLEALLSRYNLTNSSRVPRSQYLKNPNIGTCKWMGEEIPNLHLDQLNRAGYDRLIADFNNGVFSGITKSAAYMAATIYGRNSNVATNLTTGALSGGVGPLDFSIRCKQKLMDHRLLLSEGRHQFITGSYNTVKATNQDFCYFDPPYLASSFKYGGWTEQDERQLLAYIDTLPCPWALSNTLQSGTKINTILTNWASNKIVIRINKSYRKWAGGGTDSYTRATKINDEVLILSGQFRQTVNTFGNGLFEIVN